MDSRTPVPSNVKRQLRQEAGFGCCKCGHPFVEYHHIVPYTREDPHFRVNDMMCLCPNCHHEATVGAIQNLDQRYLKNHPFNIRHSKAKGQLVLNQRQLVLEIGSTQFVNDHPIISIDNENILQIRLNSFGRIDLSLSLYDSNNNLLLEIVDNEWVSGDFMPWDIEYGFQWITIREKKGKINLSIDARLFPVSLHGHLYYNEQQIDFRRDGIYFKKQNTSFGNLCLVGCGINIDSANMSVTMTPHPIYNQMYFVSESNVTKRISDGLFAFEKMRDGYLGIRH